MFRQWHLLEPDFQSFFLWNEIKKKYLWIFQLSMVTYDSLLRSVFFTWNYMWTILTILDTWNTFSISNFNIFGFTRLRNRPMIHPWSKRGHFIILEFDILSTVMFTFQLLQQKNTYYRILYGPRHKSCMAMGSDRDIFYNQTSNHFFYEVKLKKNIYEYFNSLW
jgi:hypothetical protein